MKFGPTEHANLGADRSHARAEMIRDFAEKLTYGNVRCMKCRHRRASECASVDDHLTAVCATCKSDIDMDLEIAEQKRRRELLGTRL